MGNTLKSKIVTTFTILVLFLTTFQGLIPTIPATNEELIKIISAVTMFLVSALTLWKQKLSIEISNNSIWPTIIVTIVATFGLFNDLLNVIPIPDAAGQWIRFGVTALTMFLNLFSKMWWPTSETKSSF